MRLLLPFAFFLACSLSGAAVNAEELPDPRPTPTLSTFLHIDTNRPLTLRRNVGRFGQLVCEAPCDKTIAYDDGDTFSITGSFVGADSFRIGPVGPRADLRVDAASSAGFHTGIVLGAAGFSALTISAMVFVLATLGDALGSGDGSNSALARGLYGTMIGGGAALAIGFPLIFVSQTKVEVLPNPRNTQARGLLTVRF